MPACCGAHTVGIDERDLLGFFDDESDSKFSVGDTIGSALSTSLSPPPFLLSSPLLPSLRSRSSARGCSLV
jgi:hypothetical protein